MPALKHLLTILLATIALAADPPAGQVVPIEVIGNAVWLRVSVEGGPPRIFLFDSAAGVSCVNRRTAEADGLKFIEQGERPNAGSGDGTTKLAAMPNVHLSVGGAAVFAPRLGIVPLDTVASSYGRWMEGILGVELFVQYVTALDYQRSTITLFPLKDHPHPQDATAVPMALLDGKPLVRIGITHPGMAEVAGDFLVDAPHRGAMLVNSSFVDRHGLIPLAEKLVPRLLPDATLGVAGESSALFGRLSSLRLGPFVFDHPAVTFSRAKGGSLARNDFAGILGAAILSRFRSTFDYPCKTLWLEPNEKLRDPFEGEKTGLRIRAQGPQLRDYRVQSVMPDSPASESGLRAGDVLVTLDGRPVREFELSELRRLLGRDGIRRVNVRRDSETVDCILRPRPLF